MERFDDMLAFMADVHIGNHRKFGGGLVRGINTRCRLTANTLRRAMMKCNEVDAEDIIIAGDLFHSSNPSPQLIYRVGYELVNADIMGVVHLLVGNHDQISSELGDHAISPYSLIQQYTNRFSAREAKLYVHEVPQVKWLYRNGEQVDLMMIPFRPGRAEDYLSEVIEETADQLRPDSHRILCLHLGIWDDETKPFLKGCNDAISIDLVRELLFTYRFRLVIAGNWHSYRRWDFEHFDGEHCFVVQCGALCPTGFSDLGHDDKGNIITWDGIEPQFISIPGPRFFKFPSIDHMADFLEETIVADMPLGYHLYLKVLATKEEEENVEEMVAEAKEKGVVIDGVEIARDDAEERSQARTAASVARKTENVEEALHNYIDGFPMNELSDKENVKSKILEYKKQAYTQG